MPRWILVVVVSWLSACGAAFQSGALHAETRPARDRIYFDTPPSVEQMSHHLFPSRTRGLVFANNAGPVSSRSSAESAQTSPSVEPAEKSVGMPVLFHFGKTSLVDSTKPFLDSVGELMQQPIHEHETLIIEGHTDSVGSDEANFHLSELRALAVKQYLVDTFDINPHRLFPQGRGEGQLFDENEPKSGVNRRVEFLRFKPRP